jgi:hypothetical protein
MDSGWQCLSAMISAVWVRDIRDRAVERNADRQRQWGLAVFAVLGDASR